MFPSQAAVRNHTWALLQARGPSPQSESAAITQGRPGMTVAPLVDLDQAVGPV